MWTGASDTYFLTTNAILRRWAQLKFRSFSLTWQPKGVAASTQNQALNALVFLYKQVLQKEVGELGPTERAKKPERLPTVMSREETGNLLAAMTGGYQLMAEFFYGCGLRLMECVRLRIKDVDFEQNQILVRDGKGMKDWRPATISGRSRSCWGTRMSPRR